MTGVVGLLGVVGLAMSQYRGTHASVSLHGVNYSDREFSYFIAAPENPKKTIGGEHIAPFAAGGTTCCAVLPWKWKPGTKVRLTTIHWLKKRPDGSLPEVTEEHEVEVPEYAEAGELWVIRDGKGKIGVVSSNVQPDHPAWPGKIKGWPIPSLEYQRQRWELYIHQKRTYMKAYADSLKELESEPDEQAKEAWNHAAEYNPSELKGFSGPNDPDYKSHLRKTYSVRLEELKTEFADLLRSKP
ncbi:hypothetical protein JN27_13595 [Massilia sp. BSC265]|nr:hypothetical protein JN27_13595 [Massilia sp. BSC265]